MINYCAFVDSDIRGRHDVFVDTLLIPCNTIMAMLVGFDEALDVTGHYPVVAGY